MGVFFCFNTDVRNWKNYLTCEFSFQSTLWKTKETLHEKAWIGENIQKNLKLKEINKEN